MSKSAKIHKTGKWVNSKRLNISQENLLADQRNTGPQRMAKAERCRLKYK